MNSYNRGALVSLRSIYQAANLPKLVAARNVSTDAAHKNNIAQDVPKDRNEKFTISLASDHFETYNLDFPSTELQVTPQELLDAYYHMSVVRRMETAADALYKAKKIRGFCHLSIGQEAVAVGIEQAISKDDSVITSYRCHGFAYMRGEPVHGVLAELMGRRNGVSYGKGGSMHMFAPGFYGGNGIVGAQVPVGAGLAFAHRYQKNKQAAFVLYGDGAANQGQVFESFNMAKLWNLPCIFICENNKYGMGTAAERSSGSVEYHTRGQFIPGLRVNAMDVLAVRLASKFAKEYTVNNEKPLVMEYVTYRYGGHSMSDPGTTYRTRDEIQRIRAAQDPIAGLKQLILNWGVAEESELKKLDKEAKSHVDAELKKAEEGTAPDNEPRILFEDSYVRGSEPERVMGRVIEEEFKFQ